MSNFTFLRTTLSGAYNDCARAESYATSDPRAACVYARRAVEVLVQHLFLVLNLAEPYQRDLAARINDPEFQRHAGTAITAKLNLIRLVGNDAVHKSAAIRPEKALGVLRDLHHVMVWAAFHHSARPQDVPTRAAFDPALAAKAAPLSRDDLVRLAARFKAQDEAHAKELAERDELAAAQDAEIARLREQIAAAQAANTRIDDRDYNEAETRDQFIDVLLGEAGWPLSDVRDREYEVTGMPVSTSSTSGVSTGSVSTSSTGGGGKGFVDYVLWGADGLPLAVVEAKRTRKSPAVGQQQAKLYADCLQTQFGRRPVIFYTNGYEHWLWDDAGGYPPRQVRGFLTRDELELMIQRRQTRLPLTEAPSDDTIVERPYQTRAIRAIGQSLDAKQRAALLVMATGAGKTRTVIALVDQLMRRNWVKRTLFLADRTALVRQAANAFKAHLPSVATVNLVEEKGADGRVYVSTYPTMLNLINQVDDAGRRFGPGYFDLIVIDEAHRSVYAKYGAIFDYFDSLLVGLTATPKDEVDHNTYRLFHLEDGVPTDAYSLEEAVADGYLVPPWAVSVGTKFLRTGIRYDELSDDEKDQWDSLEWGEDGPPDEVGAEELNRFLFNEDTVDKVLATLMEDGYKVAGGDRLGKTIIFAKSRAHADFIQQRFDLGWPEYAGAFARVIVHGNSYAQSLIDDFSVKDKAPHIAISVDMLDTGIDVPEVVNLVFFKMVRSKTKFWQMIGRGTRLCPDLFGPGQPKTDFLVFDFCGNLEYFSQNLPSTEGSTQKSLSERIYEARLGLVVGLDQAKQDAELRREAARELHAFVEGMTLDNVLVRPHRRAVERFARWDSWVSFSDVDAEQALGLAGLPSAAKDSDEDAKRFDLIILRRQLAQLEGDAVTAERLRASVQSIAVALLSKLAIPSVAAQAELLESVAGDEWWIDVSLPMLELARLRIRSLVRFVEKAGRKPIYTDFEDTLGEAIDVTLPYATPGTDPVRFQAKAAAYLRQHLDHVALQRLRRNKQLTSDDVSSLERMLLEAGGRASDVERAGAEAGGLGLFIRGLVGLDRVAATEAFGHFLIDTQFTVDQIRFVQLIIDELTATGVMEPSRLFESPFTDHAPTGPDQVFGEGDVTSIVGILREVKTHALPVDVA